MFPLIAISAFFILGIAFFAIGKDDFGIKKIKENSNNTSAKKEEVENPNSRSKNKSMEGEEELNTESPPKIETTTKIPD